MWNCSSFYAIINHIDFNGNITQSFIADLGNIDDNVYGGGDAIRSGAKDWRGNVYLGGSITNYMHTPAGNVTNTDGASGNFFIAKIGTSSCTCPTPGVSFTVSTSGDTLRLSATTTSQHDSIIWHYGDGTSGKGDTLRHTYAHDGTYTITGIAYNACGRDSLVRQVTVSGGCAVPQISFTYLLSGDTLRLSPVVTGSYDSIVWVFDDGTTAMADTVQHIYQHDDTYLVSAIVYNSCGHSSTAQAITVTTAGIGEVARYRTFLYPNPTGDKINVQVAAPATLGLLSASGTMLWSAPHELSQAGTYVFDLSSYAAGIYYCVVAYTAGQTEVLSVSKR
ncbi:MAG: hypothetical protein JST83_11665 [Bacteroidetes bacterium]|nr:hypothetical protein [Bacteroidota bacterium]